MIRNGEEKATITGLFDFNNKRLSAYLDSLDIEHIDNKIEVNRTISNSKNVIRVNGKVISLNELKVIAKYLADIHEQFDMVKLLNKENYLDIVDGFKYDLINEYKDIYLSSLEKLKEKEKEYQSLVNQINDIKAKRDSYEYALKELTSFDLKDGEEEEIDEEIELLNNFDKIYELLQESKEIIEKDSLSDIYSIKENINKLSKYQSEYVEVYEKINDHYYELEAIYEDLIKKVDRLDYDPKRLDDLIERKNSLSQLKKKYGKDTKELIEYQETLKKLLQSNEDLDISLKEKRDELSAQYDETYGYALNLSKVRQEVSLNIEKELMNNLKDLSLSSIFKIVINTQKKDDNLSLSIFNENGIDDIDFYIETNIGEGLKPLSKVVSGGEMSRIMLAIKVLFIKSQKISTVIFDEIDTGISGEIAQKVALKIKEISLNTQVITITHLPQVASLSNSHIKISKEVKGNRTFTSIKELSLDEKIYEIALMISDGKVSEKQLEYAKEMVLSNI
ncbi:MAG: hypothetical protein J5955_05970, partial [Bacilli bacterium]|nr:hypothetical protein [Bacilli bacterium]